MFQGCRNFGGNFYEYSKTEPINKIDLNGVSPKDVREIEKTFDEIIEEKTNDGIRTYGAT